MTKAQQEEITKISQEFAAPFEETFGGIAGTGWLIVDPLSGYLNFTGHTHTLSQRPEGDGCPQVLFLEFPDGSKFIPAGGDLAPLLASFHNWMWIPA